MQLFKDYDQCVQYLTKELYKSVPSILRDKAAFDKSREILAALDNPQNTTPTIHIAATSGKGSVAYGVDAILRAHGFHTTLMVSPHAYDIRERIQHDGQLIDPGSFVDITNELLAIMAKTSLHPTYFEALMSMGFLAARRHQSDYVVTETGLGGLWDTSNTITRPDKIAVVGSIGLDHTHILGNSLEEIASQKAGIMRRNGQAVVLSQSTSVSNIFKSIADERNTTLNWVEPEATSYDTNWRMAKTTVQLLAARDGWPYSEGDAETAIRNLRIPARFEVRQFGKKTIILDAAHNPQKAAALVAWIQQRYPGQTFTTVLAISEGKAANEIVQILNSVTERYIITAFLTDQQDLPLHAIPAETLAELVQQYASGRPVQVYANAKNALESTLAHHKAPLLITGSFYLVGELGNLLSNPEIRDAQ